MGIFQRPIELAPERIEDPHFEVYMVALLLAIAVTFRLATAPAAAKAFINCSFVRPITAGITGTKKTAIVPCEQRLIVVLLNQAGWIRHRFELLAHQRPGYSSTLFRESTLATACRLKPGEQAVSRGMIAQLRRPVLTTQIEGNYMSSDL